MFLCALAFADDLLLPRRDGAALVLDGRANEAVWADALLLPEPLVFQPSDDLAPVGSVTTRILGTADAMWVSFVVIDPEPQLVRAGLGRRDSRPDDTVGLLLDPSGDGRRAYELLVTPLGVQLDRLDVPGPFDDDWSWDAVWRSAGGPRADGWEAEIAIPWASVYMTGEVDGFGLVVLRHLARRDQTYAWPRVTPGTDPLLAAARIAGPGSLPHRIGLELRPEITGAWSAPRVPSGRLELAGIGPGLTVRYAPNRHVGAAATINPDFSQLESDADQIDVNQRFALYYEEKRPFFLEDQEWFDHPVDDMVYTRSMVAPLYGARATGELGSLGLSALNVLDRAPAPSVNEEGGWTASQLAGHDALVSLARARFGLGGESYVSLFGSDKSILGTDLSNRVFGIDSTVRLEKRLVVEAAALGSATVFEDGGDPSLAPAAEIDARFSGKRFFLHARADAAAPDFRQENGYRSHADFAGAFTEDHVRFYPEWDWLPLVAVEPIDAWLYRGWDGRPREQGWDPSAWVQFGNGAFLKVDGHTSIEEFAGELLPSQYAEIYGSLEIGEVLRAEIDVSAGLIPIYDSADPRSGKGRGAWTSIELQPVPPFTLAVEPALQAMNEVDGTPTFVAWTGRARAELFVSRAAWFRVVGQLGGDDHGLSSWRVEPVAAVEWTPGRAIYLGGSYGESEGRFWQVFGKASWTFRV